MLKNKKSYFKIILTVFLGIIISLFFLVIDFFNVPTLLGIEVSRLNFDALSLVVGNIFVVVMFLITYFIIDSRDIKKDNNQKDVAYLLLNNTYEYCGIIINSFYNDSYRESYIRTSGTDNSDLEGEINHIAELPFINSNMIFEFAASGVIDKETFEEYLDIKRGFQDFLFIATSYTVFDDDSDFLEVAYQMECKVQNEKFRLIDCYK